MPVASPMTAARPGPVRVADRARSCSSRRSGPACGSSCPAASGPHAGTPTWSDHRMGQAHAHLLVVEQVLVQLSPDREPVQTRLRRDRRRHRPRWHPGGGRRRPDLRRRWRGPDHRRRRPAGRPRGQLRGRLPRGSDTLRGGAANDVITGDNAVLSLSASDPSPLIAGRGFDLPHAIVLLDLGESHDAATSAGDLAMRWSRR